MKRTRLAVLTLALGSLIGCSSPGTFSDFDLRSEPDAEAFAYAPVQSMAQMPPAASAPLPTDPALRAIATSPNPSEVVAAYAQALTVGANRTAAEQVFVRRMVELGVPEMAAKQASDLNQAKPDDGLAWGVSSYDSARQGDTNTALRDIVKAVNAAHDDPFVLRTAGQLMAWYDLHADKTAIPADLQDAITSLKTRIEQKPVFAAAYQDAQHLYENPAATQPSAVGNPATAPIVTAPEYGQTVPEYGEAAPPEIVYPPAPAPIYPSPYGYTYEPYPAPNYWWYPSYPPYYGYWGGSTFLYIPYRHFHEHHFEFRHEHRREFHEPEHHKFEHGPREFHEPEHHEPQFFRGGIEHRPDMGSGRTHIHLDQPNRHNPESRMIGPLPQQKYRARSRGPAEPAPHPRSSERSIVHFNPSAPPLTNQGPKPAPAPQPHSAPGHSSHGSRTGR